MEGVDQERPLPDKLGDDTDRLQVAESASLPASARWPLSWWRSGRSALCRPCDREASVLEHRRAQIASL